MHPRNVVARTAGAFVVLTALVSCTVNGKYYSWNDMFGGSDALPTMYGAGEENLVFDHDSVELRLDAAGHTVHGLSDSGQNERTWGGLGDRPGQTNYPITAAFGPNGRIYVLGRGNDRVQVFTPEGTHVAFLGHDLYMAADLAVDGDGLVYVCNTIHHRVDVYSLRSPDEVVRSIGTEGELNGPSGIAITDDGELHVVDAGNARIQVFAKGGSALRSYGEYGSEPGKLLRPNSIVVDREDRVSVADPSSGLISVFDTDGTFLGRFQPVDEDGPVVPVTLRVAPDGRLYARTAGSVPPGT